MNQKDLPPGWQGLAKRTTLRKRGDNSAVLFEGFNCGCFMLIMALNLIVGKMSVEYIALTGFGATVPFWPALVGGLVLGQVTIPLAILFWILAAAGVHVPFFN